MYSLYIKVVSLINLSAKVGLYKQILDDLEKKFVELMVSPDR